MAADAISPRRAEAAPRGPEVEPVLAPLRVAAPATAGDGKTLDVRADDPWAEAGRKVLGLHLSRMLARVPGVIAGEDPEEVHAMRVAARRMRAAWRVFGDGYERAAARRYRDELRDIGARLGAVRDLDVLIEVVASRGAQHGSARRAGVDALLAAWRTEREALRVELVATIASPRFGQFIADYLVLVGTPGHASVTLPPHAPALVRSRMPARLWAAYQEVWGFADAMTTADLATLHELRIAGKWLRYALEFVREPIGPEAAPLIRPIVALQDHLGTQHDLHVAAERARSFAVAALATGQEVTSVNKLAAQLDRDVERLGKGIAATWRPIVAPVYRRRLGRAIARL
jgi:CHAD domain-containing protein